MCNGGAYYGGVASEGFAVKTALHCMDSQSMLSVQKQPARCQAALRERPACSVMKQSKAITAPPASSDGDTAIKCKPHCSLAVTLLSPQPTLLLFLALSLRFELSLLLLLAKRLFARHVVAMIQATVHGTTLSTASNSLKLQLQSNQTVAATVFGALRPALIGYQFGNLPLLSRCRPHYTSSSSSPAPGPCS